MSYRFRHHVFRSTEEVARARELAGIEGTGRISDLQLHPRLKLSAADVPYTPTFGYVENGDQVYEQFKAAGAESRLRDVLRLWTVYGPGVLRLTRVRKGKLVFRDIPGGRNPQEADDNRFNR